MRYVLLSAVPGLMVGCRRGDSNDTPTPTPTPTPTNNDRQTIRDWILAGANP